MGEGGRKRWGKVEGEGVGRGTRGGGSRERMGRR